MTKKRIAIVGAFLSLIIICELWARYGMGLGDPPLLVGDAEIDYIFAPNQDCNRFGNRVIYNDASMRCDFDVLTNIETISRRFFVVGDSVVNGGVLTDHSRLATTLLQERIDPQRKKTQICHVSAGSWGPGNYAAYFKKYSKLIGTNDIIIVEVNSHDLWEDDPMIYGGARVGVDVFLPDHKPCCALWDGFNRYFIPMVRRQLGLAQIVTKVDVPMWQEDCNNGAAQYNIKMLDQIFAYPWSKRYLYIHRTREENRRGNISSGEAVFRQYALNNAIEIIEPKYDDDCYRDTVHLSVKGQEAMYDAIYSVVEK